MHPVGGDLPPPPKLQQGCAWLQRTTSDHKPFPMAFIPAFIRPKEHSMCTKYWPLQCIQISRSVLLDFIAPDKGAVMVLCREKRP